MGNQQTHNKSHNVEVQLNHSKINTITVSTDPKTNQKFMRAVFGVDHKEYKAWVEELERAKPNRQYLLLPFRHDFNSNALCGSAGTAKVDYQNYPYLLIEQIENRRAKKKRFDQTQLWMLLFCLLDGAKQMQNGNSSRIGDVRPHNIFLNEQGSLKVANILSWPREVSNFQKFLENQITYLAPQDMQFIKTSSLDNQANKLSQIFSIGLTVLSAANLTDYSYLYSIKNSDFDQNQFERLIREWRLSQIYSDIFKATLASLLTAQTHRISVLEIQPWLSQYKKQILSRQDFIIADPPNKIMNEVQIIKTLYQENRSQPQSYVPSYVPSSYVNFQRKDYRNNQGHHLQGSRRIGEERKLHPVTNVPGTTTTESIYTPLQGSQYRGYNVQFNHEEIKPMCLDRTYEAVHGLDRKPDIKYQPKDLDRTYEAVHGIDRKIDTNQESTNQASYTQPWLLQGVPLQGNTKFTYVPRAEINPTTNITKIQSSENNKETQQKNQNQYQNQQQNERNAAQKDQKSTNQPQIVEDSAQKDSQTQNQNHRQEQQASQTVYQRENVADNNKE